MKVRLAGIRKRFGQVVANDGVDLEIAPGEVLALLGENGAGKSTLMKVLYGQQRADGGSIYIDEVERRIDSPRRARELGIGMVFQQGSGIGRLSVVENLVLGAQGVSFWRPSRVRSGRAATPSAAERAVAQLRALAPGIDPERSFDELSAGERQIVELAKLLWRGARLLILDEPTSLIARPDAERLWQHVRGLAAQGHSIVMITHKLDDVANAAQRVVVMRAGRIVHDSRETAAREPLLRAMLGERGALPLKAARPRGAPGATRLVVSQLAAAAGSERLEAVSFDVARGEIFGIAGVTGNGQELLGRVLAAVARAASGRITLDGVELMPEARALRRGVAYIPELPRLNACATDQSLLVNLCALEIGRFPWLLDLPARRARAAALLERFAVRPRELDRAAGTLSGGNLQKLVIARELSGRPALIVACFPSLGLDLAAAGELARELVAQAERGAAVVWISEELEAILEHADRIAVLHRGRLRGPLPRSAASLSRLGAWMTGAEA